MKPRIQCVLAPWKPGFIAAGGVVLALWKPGFIAAGRVVLAPWKPGSIGAGGVAAGAAAGEDAVGQGQAADVGAGA